MYYYDKELSENREEEGCNTILKCYYLKTEKRTHMINDEGIP